MTAVLKCKKLDLRDKSVQCCIREVVECCNVVPVGVFSAAAVLIRRGAVGRQISEGRPEAYFVTSAY